ncbi:hypothetical protein [Massilia antarctica]|uniref:hypothetical protein n=1 Tax=Massilia antarctica TaxID=2765360 RepID=UPI0035E9E906
MKFPEKNSRSEKILMAFLKGAMTIYQGAEIHGDFVTRKLPTGVDHAKMVELYCDLVARGCLVREGIMYKLTMRARHQLDKVAAADTPRSIVPPRVRNFFAKPLFLGYSPAFPWRCTL